MRFQMRPPLSYWWSHQGLYSTKHSNCFGPVNLSLLINWLKTLSKCAFLCNDSMALNACDSDEVEGDPGAWNEKNMEKAQAWLLFWLCFSSTLSLDLSFLICKLWALIQNQGQQVAGSCAALFSLHGRHCWTVSWHDCSFLPNMVLWAAIWFSRWNPFIIHLDETTWTWTPLFIMVWVLSCKEPTKSVMPPWAAGVGFRLHISRTEPLNCWQCFPPSYPCTLLDLALPSAWPLIFPRVREPVQMPLPLQKPSSNLPYRITHFFSCVLNVGRSKRTKMLNQAVFRDCNKPISPKARPRGNKGRFPLW